jgi:alpha-D-ribose 1-methylphosphonate 5-phosphate C-P lyase
VLRSKSGTKKRFDAIVQQAPFGPLKSRLAGTESGHGGGVQFIEMVGPDTDNFFLVMEAGVRTPSKSAAIPRYIHRDLLTKSCRQFEFGIEAALVETRHSLPETQSPSGARRCCQLGKTPSCHFITRKETV